MRSLLLAAILIGVTHAVTCRRQHLQYSADGMGLVVPDQCTELRIDGEENVISDGTLFEALENHPSLENLFLDREPRRARDSGSQVTVDAMKQLATVLPSTKISHLSVSYNPVGDEAFRAVADVLPSTNIRRLWFKEAAVSDAAVIELTDVLKKDQTSLEDLDLSHNPDVSTGLLQHLIQAAEGHSKLNFVGLEGSSAAIVPDAKHVHLMTLLKDKCVMGAWDTWSPCDAKSCDAVGEMKRKRNVLHAPKRLENSDCGQPVEMVKSCQMKCDKAGPDGRRLSTGEFKMGPERLLHPVQKAPEAVPLPHEVQENMKTTVSAAAPAVGKASSSPVETPSSQVPQPVNPAQEAHGKEPLSGRMGGASRLRTSKVAEAATGQPQPRVAEKKPKHEAEPELGLGMPAKMKSSTAAAPGEATKKPSDAEPASRLRGETLVADEPSASAPSSSSSPEAKGDPVVDVQEEAPAPEPAVKTFEERLTAFYQKYNPQKLNSVDNMLVKYRGREEVLLKNLVNKYGPEPDDETKKADVEQEKSANTPEARKAWGW